MFPRVHLREFVSVSDNHAPSIHFQLPAHGTRDSLHGTRFRPAGKPLQPSPSLALTGPNKRRADSDQFYHDTRCIFRRCSSRHAGTGTTYSGNRAQ